MTKSKIFIHWFRQDLRITDNPSLYSCAKQGLVFPIYILDDKNSGEFSMGQASRYFLYHSLQSLNKSLEGNLRVYKGDAIKIIEDIIKNNDISCIQWNRCYEPWRLKRDKRIQKMLKEKKVDYQDFNGSLLWEPWSVAKNDGNPYKVFTPFYKNGCLQVDAPQQPLEIPENIDFFTVKVEGTIDIKEVKPSKEFCEQIDKSNWKIGEQNALKKLDKFIKNKLNKYGKGRDYPGQKNVSRLSPHMHFGEVSPHYVWYQIKKFKGSTSNIDKFKSELAWREFAYYLLYHFPDITTKNYQSKFDDYPWQKGGKNLECWQKGQTGYPMVDAAMRELNQTGYMHNRSRMIVASFLTKNLNIHWREGEKYFWDRLLDADLASNSASWQWVAGCGLDAAPFFRVFNIVTQGSKFDPNGDYVYKYCPELKNLSIKYLFDPTNAPEQELKKSNIKLGKDYPKAIRRSIKRIQKDN